MAYALNESLNTNMLIMYGLEVGINIWLLFEEKKFYKLKLCVNLLKLALGNVSVCI